MQFRSGQIESARNPHCREPNRNDASETERNNDDCTKFVGHSSASLSEVTAWDASQECATIHSRARFSEVNLPNKRTKPFGSVICTRHIWPLRTVANFAEITAREQRTCLTGRVMPPRRSFRLYIPHPGERRTLAPAAWPICECYFFISWSRSACSASFSQT